MFGIGSSEMIILAIIALLLFGKRLPEVARSLGKGMMEFKKGMYDIQDEVMSATSSRPATQPQSRPIASDLRDEAVAPKFEPPKFEPGEVTPEQPA
ncbi:MAG: twin-arginine translocase TatA/TatE family subunit [Planctomycetes bacterium]|nr:twin-arginine translocase TatA/TatE family subunit [Planctomycetota bacterium]